MDLSMEMKSKPLIFMWGKADATTGARVQQNLVQLA